MASHHIRRFLRVGKLVAAALVLRARLKVRHPRRPVVLVFRLGGFGDVICTFPAVLALREQYPQAILVYASRPACRSLIEMSGCADEFLEAEWLRPLIRLYEKCFDQVYEMRLEDEQPAGNAPMHLVDEFSRCLQVAPDSRQPRMRVPESLQNRLQEEYSNIRKGKGPLIGIQTGPSWPVRMWPEQHWERLTQLLCDQDATVIQLGADTHMGLANVQAERVPGTVDWVGRWTLEETAAAIAACDLFIGIDSGLLHIAGAVGTPTVGIFGPIDPTLRMPPETPSRAVFVPLACSGCHHRLPKLHWITGCPHEIACMNAVKPEDVHAAAVALLRAPHAMHSAENYTRREQAAL
jgi:ADP-heptose:LPS heptosyltransferase